MSHRESIRHINYVAIDISTNFNFVVTILSNIDVIHSSISSIYIMDRGSVTSSSKIITKSL